ncbi:MAG: peptidoglycan editing factor PgeF [Lachnospiraceae bacterium]|nr:peptidoglycan editing factor PgeF [Lachnospiraceae bacterium]
MQKSEFRLSNENQSTMIQEKNGVPFITFSKLKEAGVTHGFSTRLGGVSQEHLASMNLSFARGDSPLNVHENFRRMGEAIGFTPEQLVFSDQQHQSVIRKVTKEDAGKGIVRTRDYTCVDGLVTDEPGLCLTTFYADCVPLFFYDPVKKVVALAHSGWRGTVAKIGAKMVHLMERDYGCMDYNIIAAIGPSICKDCYEVSRDVYEEFEKSFAVSELEEIFEAKTDGKYQLDLWKANELILTQAGIQKEHLDVTDICTCCNPDLLFSHRASHGKRGNLAAFIML